MHDIPALRAAMARLRLTALGCDAGFFADGKHADGTATLPSQQSFNDQTI